MTPEGDRPMLVAGTFPAEAAWADEGTARLPAARVSPSRPRWLDGMDELLAPLCGSSDVLVTREPRCEHLVDYHAGLGIEPLCLNVGEVCRALGSDRNPVTPQPDLRPYAVTPDVVDWARSIGVATTVPDVEVVRRVNSKAFSARLGHSLGVGAGGAVVHSSRELISRARGLGEGRGVVVKEPHGVAGSGTLLLETESQLERVARHLTRQERAGRCVEMVVEPWLDVSRSFSAQLEILPDGEVRTPRIQQIESRRFSYVASSPAEPDLLRTLERYDYRSALDAVAATLHGEGYFGPVCVDSLLTADGGMVVVGEINARESMGSINAALGDALAPFAMTSRLTSVTLTAPRQVKAEELLVALEEHRLLFGPEHPDGVLPLTGSTLPRPEDGSAVALGRFYYALPQGPNASPPQVTPALLGSALESLGLGVA